MGLVVLKVSFLLLLLLGVTTARLDLLTHDHKGYDPSSDSEEAKPCCDSCMCTRSMPPQCRCADVRLNSCHSACKRCLCLYSYPGQCQCIDTNDFCYPPCKRSDEDDEDH